MTISYKAGKFEFSCDTEGAIFHYSINTADPATSGVSTGSVEFGSYLNVSVYASADGYVKSKTVTYKLPLNPGLKGDINNDGEINIVDEVELANLILNSHLIAGHEYVDLGLPSGTMWASCNVGAYKPEDYGDRFAWGETSPKENYNSESLFDKNGDKYNRNGGKIILEPEDDAAHVNWGGDWRMPTREDMLELVEECEWTVAQHGDINGYVVKSKINENIIFLPFDSQNYDIGKYWSSYLEGTYYATFLQLSDENIWVLGYNGERYHGYVVRPVCNPNK